ncbi:MFS transporter [Pigmentiphaga litoralis]|uniref:MFS family permease n=1 Tax=Pigmentiphaga litoralis TaxID=516702 RepID=A0A7Y9IZN4_9BURK|nr:MFS transporter [Pigmentiphaga litoralis]NYE26810.1 MFS family permease [Pigmentiphaga litoralis]NYE85780.1 MFS family permease [Pigmentiphaga litoralis]
MTQTPPPRSPAAELTPLVLIVLAGFLSIGIPLPALALYVNGTLGFNAVTVGWVVGIQAFATILTRQVAGAYCDRHGPRKSVRLGLPLASVAALFYLASPFMPTPVASLAVLIVGRLIMGPAESLYLTGTMTWGIGRVGPQRTGMVMAWQGIAMFAALGVGAPIGVAVQQQWGFAGIAAITFALPLVGWVIATRMVPLAARAASAVRLSFFSVIGLIWRYGLALAFAAMPFAIITSFLVLMYSTRNWAGAGFAIAGFAAGYVAVRLFLAHLPDKMGGMTVGAVSVVIEMAGQLLLWQADSATMAFMGTVLTGIGFSLVFPSMGVEAMARVPAHARGVAVGSFLAFVDVSSGLTGPVVGLVIGLYGYQASFIVGAVACAIAVALMVSGRRRVPVS